MEYFDNLVEWARAANFDGCGIQRDHCGIYWAENWLGQSCGEFDPSTNKGFLNFG